MSNADVLLDLPMVTMRNHGLYYVVKEGSEYWYVLKSLYLYGDLSGVPEEKSGMFTLRVKRIHDFYSSEDGYFASFIEAFFFGWEGFMLPSKGLSEYSAACTMTENICGFENFRNDSHMSVTTSMYDWSLKYLGREWIRFNNKWAAVIHTYWRMEGDTSYLKEWV